MNRRWLGPPILQCIQEPEANEPPRITHVARIAHARRKFFGVGTTKSPIAEHELRHIQALYAIKAGINSKPIASVVLSIGGHPPTPRFPAHRGHA